MPDITANTIALEAAIERLRQERETFDQRKAQEDRWFALQLRMGYVAVVLLPSVAVLSGYIVWSPGGYPASAVTAASAALFVDVLGVLGTVWKVVLKPVPSTKLMPVTSTKQLDQLARSKLT